MLGGSIPLGYLIARVYSEPLKRRLRTASGLVSAAARAQARQRPNTATSRWNTRAWMDRGQRRLTLLL